MKTNKLEGNSTKYAEVYFTHSLEPFIVPLVITFGGDFLFSFG